MSERKHIHELMCPIMDLDGCSTVGGYSKHHDRGVAGNCRCGKRCECVLVRQICEDIATRIEEYADDLDWDGVVATRGEVLAIRHLVQDELHACAAIARGETQ